MRQKEILYNPSLSVKANAKANGVSEASIRYYIKVNGIDRRADEKVRKIDICRKYYRYHSDANINQMAKDTKVSYFFIKQNWDYIKGEKVFDNFDELDIIGGVLKVDGRVVAYTMGEPGSKDVFCVHIEKAFSDVRGAYPMINQQFVMNELSGYKYINREDDTGAENLRKAKLSYYPAFLAEKYEAKPKKC